MAQASTTVPEPAKENCDALELVDEVWTPQRREQLAAHLAEAPGEWPEVALASLATRVETGREDWRRRYIGACEQRRPKALRCLELRLWQLDALVDLLLARPPEMAAQRWPAINHAFVGLEGCEASEFASQPLPRELGRELAQLSMLINDEASTLGPRVRALAAEPQVAAEPGYLRSALGFEVWVAAAEGDAEAVDRTLQRLRAIADDRPRTMASMAQFEALATLSRGQLEAGVAHLEAGLGHARAEPDARTRFLLLSSMAGLWTRFVGEGAGPLLAEAVAVSTRLGDVENPYTAEAQASLASLQVKAGELSRAYELLLQARDAFAASLGVDHPRTLRTVRQIAELAVAAGRFDEAFYALSDLLAVYEQLHGEKHPITAEARVLLGDVLYAMEEFEGARQLYLGAMVPLTTALGPEDRSVVATVVHLGMAELALGNLDAAEAQCTRGRSLALALPEGDPLREDAASCLAKVATTR